MKTTADIVIEAVSFRTESGRAFTENMPLAYGAGQVVVVIARIRFQSSCNGGFFLGIQIPYEVWFRRAQ